MVGGLSEKLQRLRMKYGYSQKEVAERLWVSPSIVSGYETGERTPSPEVLVGISYLYHCTTDYLLGRDTQEPEVTFSGEGLTPRQIQAVRELIDSMKNPE